MSRSVLLPPNRFLWQLIEIALNLKWSYVLFNNGFPSVIGMVDLRFIFYSYGTRKLNKDESIRNGDVFFK